MGETPPRKVLVAKKRVAWKSLWGYGLVLEQRAELGLEQKAGLKIKMKE